MDLKGKSAAVVMAALIGGAGIGAVVTTPMAAFAADTTTTTTAEATARTPGQWATDALKGLVDKGTITQEQSNAVAQALEEARPAKGGGGFGHHGRDGGVAKAEAAKVLGITQAELRTALATKSLADLAKEKNIDVQKVIDALVAAENVRIDEAVTAGRLTAEQATERKAAVVAKITTLVNSVRPERDGRGGDRFADRAPATTPSTTAAA